MSELRSAIDALRTERLADALDALIEDRFEEVHRACEQLEMERLRIVAEIDRRRLFERDGHLSCAAWLVTRFRTSWNEARAKVRLARALERMPVTRDAIEEGDVSLASARVLAQAEQAHPEAFPDAEERLVEAARIHTVAELQRVATFWSQKVEEQGLALGERRLRAERALYASRTFGGMVGVDGNLDPETGEALLTALNAVLDAEARSRSGQEERSPAQRRADALGEICRQWLDRRDRPQVAGERPHVTVTVGLDTLTGVMKAAAELDHVGPVSAQLAERLACDASIQRVVLSARSEPLDIGRRTPVVPPSLRRAVVLRDRRCRFPGCDRPATWCDAHHVRHWARGGRTSLKNLVLLCRRHRRLVHEGFRLELIDGRPVFSRPDGSVLEDRGPPLPVAV